MDVDREQLQKLREQIGRKAHLTSMLDNLYVQEKEQKEKFEEHYHPFSRALWEQTLSSLGYQNLQILPFPAQRPYAPGSEHRQNRREDDEGTEGSICSLREI